MTFLLLLATLIACAASTEDMSGKMFTFPLQSNKAHVKLITSLREFSSVTVCHRSFTDLKRDHVLFSLATASNSNEFLIFWDEANKELESHVRERKTEYRGMDYKPNMWHSICTTWDSESGLVQVWFDGRPSIKKFSISGSTIRGTPIIVLGQEQDAHGGGFDINQSFVGMMSDVHMWHYILSPCEIQNYVDHLNFTPGDVINWSALEYQIVDKVLIEKKFETCH
ncbi:putative serum amyloid P-component-like isoform 3 [Scophthalmus maximus]|uniref:Pentraxin family member n=1 Tax=Scophthalmus maximus TaxID=52904 RepID=A0A2U9AYL2_SCOMX|nr:putative serum amyloid P-component-like [Scophthalmus maximus]AWO96667.1 putative serum amyloid P-component-like isoform 3 [Scophthalmus maximus]